MDEKLKRLIIIAKNKGYKAFLRKTKDNQKCVIINSPNNSMIYAFMIVDGEIVKVGCLDYTVKKDNKVFIDRLEVERDFQFIGLGRNMMLCLQDYCMEINCNKLELISLRESLKFYQKLGFSSTIVVKDLLFRCELKLPLLCELSLN